MKHKGFSSNLNARLLTGFHAGFHTVPAGTPSKSRVWPESASDVARPVRWCDTRGSHSENRLFAASNSETNLSSEPGLMGGRRDNPPNAVRMPFCRRSIDCPMDLRRPSCRTGTIRSGSRNRPNADNPPKRMIKDSRRARPSTGYGICGRETASAVGPRTVPSARSWGWLAALSFGGFQAGLSG